MDGRRLRYLRAQAGFTQQGLANVSGIGRETISEIETGKREPQAHTIGALAKALGVDVGDLLGEEAPKAVSRSSREWAAATTDEDFERAIKEEDPAGLLLVNRDLHAAIENADDRTERARLLSRVDQVLSTLMRRYGPIQPGHGWQQPQLSEELARALGRDQEERREAG